MFFDLNVLMPVLYFSGEKKSPNNSRGGYKGLERFLCMHNFLYGFA